MVKKIMVKPVIFSLVLLCSILSGISSGQDPPPEREVLVSIVVTSYDLVDKKPFLVGVKIGNNTNRKLPFGDVSLHLKKADQKISRLGETFGTYLRFNIGVGLRRKKFLEPGEKVEFGVDMTKMEWTDSMASIEMPFELFKGLPKDEYRFFARYDYGPHPAGNGRRLQVNSNVINVIYK